MNILLRGTLSDQDQGDKFVIDVKDQKDLQISVTNEQNLGLNWVLYSESDLNNYVAYATKRMETNCLEIIMQSQGNIT